MPPEKAWARKYRGAFGCEAPDRQVCFCPICVSLEQAWNEAMLAAKAAIDGVRHPAYLRQEKARE